MFKLAFWIALIGIPVFVGAQVIPVQYNNVKIQNTFEGTVKNLQNATTNDISRRMQNLLTSQSVNLKTLPEEFFENLSVEKDNGKLQIGSEYHVVLWLLGEPSIDPDSDYKQSDLAAMDKLKLRARMDFDFAPYSETP